ncbi:pentatricopeptide repeat-containing protein At1g73400, mitochondrial-like [Bidens hawaiensis]|uniref:pentatricopeptide repeat-containing protein At1g73400, mitochondrial-like n=1 Tax=Bidens hawaiensis TaxID=980011 RepID=UPI0040490F70
MSRINIIINPIRRYNIISYTSRYVSSSTPYSTPILNSSHKLFKSTPVSLQNPFPQMGHHYFTLIPSHSPEDATEAFDQTPGVHNNNPTVCVPISTNGEKLYNIVIDSNPNNNIIMETALNESGIQLTTPLVVEVLESLKYMEKLAFRFFTWAGNHENYGHEPEAYDLMIDILSNTRYKAKQYRVVCDVLDYMKRSNKTRVSVDVLLKILRQYADRHLAHLHKFAKKKKVKLKYMQPETDALNVLLDGFCKCCLVEEAETMFLKVKGKVKPNASTYNILFFGWCRVRNPSRSMQILDEMIENGFTPENFTYNTAIDTFCKSGMLSEAVELLEFMKSKGTLMSSPTAKTYAIMIIAFARADKLDECFKLVDDMVKSGCLPDVSTYREVIEGMCSVGKVNAAYKFLEHMKKTGYPPDIVTYNCFLKVLCDCKDSEEADRLYNHMIDVGCEPSVQTFNMLVMMFFKMGDVNRVFEMWGEMDNRRCVRDTDSYCVMIEGLFGCGRTEDACGVLEEVLNKGMKLPFQKFDSFLMQLSSIGDLRGINRLSEHMRKFYNPVMARRFALNQKRKSVSLRGK